MKLCAFFVIACVVLPIAGCEWLGWQMIALSQDPLSGPLTEAAAKGDVAEVDRLLAEGAPLREPYALQAAVVHRQYGMVRHLVDRGARIDGGGELQSPLWFAAVHGDTDMVRLLASLGADVDWQTEYMGTPLHAVLSTAIVDDRVGVARTLLDLGADVNRLQTDEGLRTECLATPLHAAVFSLDEAAVELMLDRGADPQAVDARERTPLACARERLTIWRGAPGQIEAIIALLAGEGVGDA